MNRNKLAPLVVAAAAALAVGLSGPASAAVPASGAAVVGESNAFFQQAARAGIVAVARPSSAVSHSAAGFSASFPVTGGTASLTGVYGSIQFGGSLVLVDAKTLKSVTFTRLTFDVDTWQITGVPQGGTAPVALLDPAGDVTVSAAGTVQTVQAPELDVDAEGAQYLDAHLRTAFFTEGQSVGSLTVNFTPAS